MPGSIAIHQKRDVLDVVVLVASNDVEGHAAELLFDRPHWQSQSADHLERLLV